ncbi:MAG: YsnF/AvaK domain-containing protein [Thermoproteota archaeon]|nr:YsnF/AvaK domain-containing protein [Thermoproteota archaeon]
MATEYNNRSSSHNNSLSESSSPSPSSMSFTPTTLQTIPVVEEKPSISKESVASNTVIEKRWVTKTELVRVPVTYEEIYVNGKPMSSGGGGVLSDLKKALSGKNDNRKESKDVKPKGEFVPVSATDLEKVIPVYGEQIVITKKMAKLDDLVIRKRRIVENKKIKVNVIKESVKIKHPNGKIEDLST